MATSVRVRTDYSCFDDHLNGHRDPHGRTPFVLGGFFGDDLPVDVRVHGRDLSAVVLLSVGRRVCIFCFMDYVLYLDE